MTKSIEWVGQINPPEISISGYLKKSIGSDKLIPVTKEIAPRADNTGAVSHKGLTLMATGNIPSDLTSDQPLSDSQFALLRSLFTNRRAIPRQLSNAFILATASVGCWILGFHSFAFMVAELNEINSVLTAIAAPHAARNGGDQ